MGTGFARIPDRGSYRLTNARAPLTLLTAPGLAGVPMAALG